MDWVLLRICPSKCELVVALALLPHRYPGYLLKCRALALLTCSEPDRALGMSGCGVQRRSRFPFLIMFSTSTWTFESSWTAGNLTLPFPSGSGVGFLQANPSLLPPSCIVSKNILQLLFVQLLGSKMAGLDY